MNFPTGTVTFLFTDIEGSTSLLRKLHDQYPDTLESHRNVIRAAVAAHGGVEMSNEGDGFAFVFARATDALAAAVECQRGLSAFSWPDDVDLRVRMGLHTGEPTLTPAGYVGLAVHLAARVGAAAHGGQVLLTQPTATLAASGLPPGVSFRDLGSHALKDFPEPHKLLQVSASDLRVDFPPPRTLASRFDNVPRPLSVCFGRERDLETLRNLFVGERIRLVTLTGPGGVGKTRLAIEAARQLGPSFDDGVCFVDLSALAHGGDVLHLLAGTLELLAGGGIATGAEALAYLCERRILIVLDNFEQLASSSDAVAQILTDCQGVSLLVTSRVRLRLRGEHEFPVEPLPTAAAAATSGSENSPGPAVLLFLDRARAAGAHLSDTPETNRSVADVCERLDCLPLAIELAAARSRLLSPRALLRQVSENTAALGGAFADLPRRQQSLHSTIAWSYDLLATSEQAAFRQLSVFTGPWSVDGAAALLGTDEATTLSLVSTLVDQSLIRPAEVDDSDMWFTMLRTIRDFAAEILDASGEGDAARKRHLEYFQGAALAFARSGPQAREAGHVRRVELQFDDFRAAMEWALDGGHEPVAAIQIVSSLQLFWYRHLSEGSQWLNRALAHADDAPPGLVARALVVGSTLAAYLGSGDAVALAERAVSVARGQGRPSVTLGNALSRLAVARGERGDLAGATAAAVESVDVLRLAGAPIFLGMALGNRGAVALWLDDLATAQTAFAEAATVLEEAGALSLAASPIGSLGTIARYRGDLARARAELGRSLELLRSGGPSAGLARPLAELGYCALTDGTAREAGALFAESLLVAREVGSHAEAIDALYGTGALLVENCRWADAARVLAAAERMREAIGQPPQPAIDRKITLRAQERVRQELGEPEWAAALARARLQSFDRAVEEGLRGLGAI